MMSVTYLLGSDEIMLEAFRERVCGMECKYTLPPLITKFIFFIMLSDE
jgi:hypothetical protein